MSKIAINHMIATATQLKASLKQKLNALTIPQSIVNIVERIMTRITDRNKIIIISPSMYTILEYFQKYQFLRHILAFLNNRT